MPWAAAALIAGGLGASSYVALGYPFFAELVGEERQGEYTGLWMFSVGFGRIVAPMLTGGIIDIGKHFMSKTKGYPLMWTTAGVVTAVGWVLLLFALHVAAKHGFEDRAADDRALDHHRKRASS
jgi:MFS family permease